MTAEPETLIAWESISLLRLDGTLLAMDRSNGRWVFLESSVEPLLRLLPAQRSLLPDDLLRDREVLSSRLLQAGLGRSETFPCAQELNTVIVKLTTACNYACTYCYDYAPENKATTAAYDLSIGAISQALEVCGGHLDIIFHGGEPMLVFNLIQQLVVSSRTLAAVAGKTISFRGQTNLSRLNRSIVDFSLRYGIRWGISLDGPGELNAGRVTHSGKETYQLFERARQEFPEFVTSFKVMTTVTVRNHDSLLRIARHFRDEGMRGWEWSLFQPVGRGRDSGTSENFCTETLVGSWNHLFDAVISGEFDGFQVGPVLKYVRNFLDGPGHDMCLKKDCGAGRDLLSVSANGTLEACDCIDPCSDLADLGSLAEGNTVEQALAGSKAEKIRSRDVAKGACGECIWLAVCGGTCLAHAYHDAGIDGVWEPQCALALNAFSRIASSLASSDRLITYAKSCRREV